MKLSKYSIGIGDRFTHQGKAQLSAVMKAKECGVSITPIWNKSYQEHKIIKSRSEDIREKAYETVKALGWQELYFVDADHIGINTVDYFQQEIITGKML